VEALVFIYFDREGLPLGESHLNPDGEILTGPPELFGVAGYLTTNAFNKLKTKIK
jgi:hypothetical protein